jgi:type 1 glutamine amidotransferase
MKMHLTSFRHVGMLLITFCLAMAVGRAAADDAAAAKKKIVFVAGPPSHGYAEHEYRADCTLLAGCLNENMPGVAAEVCTGGWPKDPHVFDGAAAIVLSCDGGPNHPAIPHLDELDQLMAKGVGLACIHFAVEAPKGKAGDDFKKWLGGYFERFWSVNPFWTADFQRFPKHPVANGLKPFRMVDEWYYHMRFVDDMKGVTPILTAVPPDEVHRNVNDAYAGNPAVFARKGMPEHLAWAYQRPGGGRGFGFTGGHVHWNWANDNYRKAVLNGIVWVAGLEVPPQGVPSKAPTFEQLSKNLDKPEPPGYDRRRWQTQLEQWRKDSAASGK